MLLQNVPNGLLLGCYRSLWIPTVTHHARQGRDAPIAALIARAGRPASFPAPREGHGPSVQRGPRERYSSRQDPLASRSFSEAKSTNTETARGMCLRFGKAAYTVVAPCRCSRSTLTRRPA